MRTYVHYFAEILKNGNISPIPKYIKTIDLVGLPLFTRNSCRPFVEIYNNADDN